MEWSWPIFFASLPIAIAFNMFGPFAKSAKNVDMYEKKTGNMINLILAGLGTITGGVILAAIITVVFRFSFFRNLIYFYLTSYLRVLFKY